MHEISITQGLLSIIHQEMAKHPGARLTRVRVKHGALANLVPESMALAWETLTLETPLAGAVLDLVELPLVLRCRDCDKEFTPEERRAGPPIHPCPHCGEELGHAVLQGRELYLDSMELDAD